MQANPPGVDPDDISETVCNGPFNVAVGPGPFATITFTHSRPKAGPLLDQGQFEMESVVRARIVTSHENLVALRKLLNELIKDEASVTIMTGSTTMN